MKRLLKVVIGVVVVLAILLVALAVFAGHIVKGAVNTAGPKALGVPMSLKGVNVNLLNGNFELDELVIGNPEGFKTPSAIRVQKVTVAVKMASLFSRVLVIDRIYVGGPEITYEVGLKGSNIGAIQDKAAPSKPSAEQPKPVDKPAKEAKKVLINDFLIESGKINVSTIGMVGNDVTIPLPTIHLTDIGKESDGATPQEVITQVFGAIGSTVGSSASGIGKGLEAIGQGAVDTGKAVGENAVGAGKALGEGAVDAGKAAGKGASEALGSVGGLLKK
ncbi:MAG: AsmA family protein [Kiritimatiellaeota bacterium]|nr:AsmA family protein [Kiritimatiellota bacterium]